jgi:hypothetical protein
MQCRPRKRAVAVRITVAGVSMFRRACDSGFHRTMNRSIRQRFKG